MRDAIEEILSSSYRVEFICAIAALLALLALLAWLVYRYVRARRADREVVTHQVLKRGMKGAALRGWLPEDTQ